MKIKNKEIELSDDIKEWVSLENPEIYNEFNKIQQLLNDSSLPKNNLIKKKENRLVYLFESIIRNYALQVEKKWDNSYFNRTVDKIVSSTNFTQLNSDYVCFGFTPSVYTLLGYNNIPLFMSSDHVFTCSQKEGFINNKDTHYHNLGKTVIKDIPFNLDNVIMIFQSKKHPEAIISILDYNVPLLDKDNNPTNKQTKLQVFIKPKKDDIKLYYSNFIREGNILATAFDVSKTKHLGNLLYFNRDKKNQLNQLASINAMDMAEVVRTAGFNIHNIKRYYSDVKHIFNIELNFDYALLKSVNKSLSENLELTSNEIIEKAIHGELLKASPVPQVPVSRTVASFEQERADKLEIIGKRFDIDEKGNPTLEGISALSKAMNIYSDKSYETSRYLFIKDGTIIRHATVSTRTPSSTLTKDTDIFWYNMKSYAQKTGSKIVFLHNHPSGYVEPSSADIELTETMNNFFNDKGKEKLFVSHIILDHGKYGLYTADDRQWNALIDDKIHPIEEIGKTYQIQLSKYNYRAKIEPDRSIHTFSLLDLADLAKKCDAGNVWNTKDWIPAFLMTENGVITSLEHINVREFENIPILNDKLKELGRSYGSENIVMFPETKEQFLTCERYAHITGKVKDVFFKNPDDTFEVSNYRNGNIFNDLKKEDLVIEDTNENLEAVKNKIFYEQSVIKTRNGKNNMLREKIPMANSEASVKLTDLVPDFVELTKSFVTGNQFSGKNPEKIADFYTQFLEKNPDDFKKIRDFNLISESQLSQSGIDEIPSEIMNVELVVPENNGEGESVTFNNEKYYLLESLPVDMQSKVLEKKEHLLAEQQVRNAKMLPLSKDNVKQFTDIFIENLDKTPIDEKKKTHTKEIIRDAIEKTSSNNEEIKKEAYSKLRIFVSAGQMLSGKSNDEEFGKTLSEFKSGNEILNWAGKLAYDQFQERRESIDSATPDYLQQIGVLRKIASSLSERRTKELLESINHPEGFGYTEEQKKNALKSNSLNPSAEQQVRNPVVTDLSKVIVIDTETTGLKADDELLQVSIIDGNGKTLFNSYVKPENKKEWKEAMAVNHISPEKVENSPSIKNLAPEIQSIIDNADMLMSYNGRFDVNLLEAAGIKTEGKPHLDVIKPAASVTKFPPKNEKDKRVADGYHYPKLTDVSEAIGYNYKAHDSLGDTTATLEVAKNIYGQNLEKLTADDLVKYTIDERMPETSKEQTVEMTEEKYHANVGKFIFEKHPEILDEIKANPGNETTKGLLERLEKYPDGKNFKTILNTMVGEAVAESHPEILKEYEGTLNGKSVVFKENPVPENSDELSGANENVSVDDLKLQLAQALEGIKKMQEMYAQAMEKNNSLQQELDMIKSQGFKPREAENSVGEPGAENLNSPSHSDGYQHNGFNRETAFIENTKVPKFGVANLETGKMEVIENAVFSHFVKNEIDNSKNEVILYAKEKDGSTREIKLPERRYQEMINAHEAFEMEKSQHEEGSYSWLRIHAKYNERMMTDENQFRMNTPENFLHNFRIHCKMEAVNQADAMRIAADMVSDMTPNDRKRFNNMRTSFFLTNDGKADKSIPKKLRGEAYDKMLLKTFDEIHAERQISEKDLSFNHTKENELLKEANKDYLEMQNGEQIPGTHTKVGDSIVFAIKTKGLDGKLKKTPKAEFKIAKVSKVSPPRAIIFNEKTKAAYVIPLKDLQNHIQKVEKERFKEENRELKKDNKIYGYDGRS